MPLKICFLDANPLDYQVASPESIPLGGSQSALCYLARALAARGHQVSVLNQTSQPGRHLGVECLNYHGLGPAFWHERDFELVVCLNDYQPLLDLPAGLKARCVFWNQHNLEVEKMDQLSGVVDRLDQVVYVSAWQQLSYQEAYGVPPGIVCPNACPPFYQPLPSVPAGYLAARPGPLTLAYTSTPNRGLSILLAIFPGLRQLFPGLKLKVFSSLKVYQMPAATDAEFSDLYAESATLPGSEYHGSVPQRELAAALRGVHILAYPNVYPETSCIAVIEAMAAGCQIVTSDRGALPETTAGYASLVPFSPDIKDFGVRFFDTLCTALRQWQTQPEAMAAKLQAQSRYTLEIHNWNRQAENWEEMAFRLMAGSSEQ
ncbi:MAG: glycosyltransferase family 4 protein [Candidatus Sericytochromatia bacterium]